MGYFHNLRPLENRLFLVWCLVCLSWEARSHGQRDESAKPRAVSRTKLRRTVPSFTVEVRRRPRLAATSRPNEQSLETKPLPAAFNRELHPAETAVIGAKKADQSCVDVSAPKGRILPSLVADEPLDRLHRDASLSFAAPSTRASPPTPAWSRTSTPSTTSARPQKPTSKAKPMRDGSSSADVMTTAASREVRWNGRRSKSCWTMSGRGRST